MFPRHQQPITKESDPFAVVASNPFARPEVALPAGAPPAAGLLLDDPALVAAPLGEGTSIDVVVGWGTSVLAVEQLTAGMSLVLAPRGDGPRQPQGPAGAVRQVRVPAELLGASERLVVRATAGAARLLVEPGAQGSYAERRAGAISRAVALQAVLDRAAASDEAGLVELPLVCGARLRVELAGLWLRLDVGERPRASFRHFAPDLGVVGYFLGSLLSFGGLLTSLAYFTPFQGLEDETGLDKERIILLQHYLSAAAIREQQTPPPSDAAAEEQAGGEAAAPAPGDPGKAGKPGADPTPKKLAIKGPADNRAPRLSPQETVALAREWGMIGLLRSSAASDPDAPISAFARDPALGSDDLNARGNMWALTIGEAAGQNGLFLSGNGIGGLDGPGTGVGIAGIHSSIGTLGHCDPSAGQLCSFGKSVGRGTGNRKPGVPILRTAPTSVSGSIPAAVVQRIVRQNFGRFRFCYEQGLARNPSLEGRVAVRFVIDRSGAVSTTAALGGGMPDSQVASCVAQAFYGLSFPPPQNGIVTVTYPLLFSPE